MVLKDNSMKTTTSVQEMLKNTEDDLSRDIRSVRGGFEIVKKTRNPMTATNKKYSQTLRRSNQSVFERLYANGRKNIPDKRLASPISINTHFRKHQCNNSVKVEDRLLEFKRKSENKLARKRADALRAELESVQQSPRILPLSQSSSYGSLLERFGTLEKDRQRKLIKRTEEKILEELSHVKRSPDINENSRRMMRGVKSMLEWEFRRKQKLELIKRKRKIKEMEEFIANQSMPMTAPGTKKYLAQIGREPSMERIENILIRYGQNANAKAKEQYETPKYSFRPVINGLEYKNSLYTPFFPYSQFVNTQESIELIKGGRLGERSSTCKSARPSKNKLVRNLPKSMKNELANASIPEYYLNFSIKE
jgi:hypothetical protein